MPIFLYIGCNHSIYELAFYHACTLSSRCALSNCHYIALPL